MPALLCFGVESHRPVDVLVLFLDVNDLKPQLGLTPEAIAGGIRALAERPAADVARILVLAPPLSLLEETAALAGPYRSVCEELGVELLDLAATVSFRPDDPRHLDVAGHAAVAHAVAGALALGPPPAVRELRLVVTAADYDDALRFYRDVLGLREREASSSPDGRITILEAASPRSSSPTRARASSSTG